MAAELMGRTQDGFAQAIVTVVQKHAPDFDPATIEMRAEPAQDFNQRIVVRIARTGSDSAQRRVRCQPGADHWRDGT